MNRLILVLASSVCAISAYSADNDAVKLEAKINRGWDLAWSRFFRAKTNLFYECLSSYEGGKEQNHLPSADEVKRQYPNPCGYATGMEDCAILGGVMLSGIVDMYEVKKDDSLRKSIHQVFEGVKTLHHGSWRIGVRRSRSLPGRRKEHLHQFVSRPIHARRPWTLAILQQLALRRKDQGRHSPAPFRHRRKDDQNGNPREQLRYAPSRWEALRARNQFDVERESGGRGEAAHDLCGNVEYHRQQEILRPLSTIYRTGNRAFRGNNPVEIRSALGDSSNAMLARASPRRRTRPEDEIEDLNSYGDGFGNCR